MGEGSSCALTATVLELLPHGGVLVELDNREQVLAHPAGAIKTNFVRLRPKDRVLVELAPGDRTRGRIMKLLRER
ncbi:MAG: translation initiation factor IF-1 [Acidobacteria bacterium]|nr:translation initiation factor IF-1 [Acidobacteriota bacterium]